MTPGAQAYPLDKRRLSGHACPGGPQVEMKNKMTRKLAVGTALAVGVGLLTACWLKCGNSSSGSAASPPPSRTVSTLPYDLSSPDDRIVLPMALAEISGLTDLSPTQVACVQDEEGTVYVYDIKRRDVVRKVPFSAAGDFEGLTAVEHGFFALRSDGVLFEITESPSGVTVREHVLSLPTKDNEGLAYDSKHQRLLISPKSRLGKGKAAKFDRAIYSFDLESRRLSSDAVLDWSVRDVMDFAEAHGLTLPMKARKKGDMRITLRLLPSSLAVHPITDEIYILSAIDGILISLGRDGAVTGYAMLDRGLFPQPEGVTFMGSGDMLISNEGAGGVPTLLRFKWRRGSSR